MIQVRRFEELKSGFYQTNYTIQNLDVSNAERLKALNSFHHRLNAFEKVLLELGELLIQGER